jgi:hypothetical protein
MFYKQIISSFIECNNVNYKSISKDNFINQYIWGNHTFDFNKKPLYFINWIRSGIIKISDLKFSNGSLDINYLCYKIDAKNDIVSELFKIQNVVSKYKLYFETEHMPTAYEQETDYGSINNKKQYAALVYKKFSTSYMEAFWLEQFGIDISILKKSYVVKYKLIKHKKIAEFNFKLYNNILPCGTNLKKWRLSENDKCDSCSQAESGLHLIFTCKCKVNIWKMICLKLGIKYDLSKLMFGYNNVETDWAISIIAYLIFKYWVFKKKNQVNCNNYMAFNNFMKIEISKTINVYANLKYKNVYNLLIIVREIF